MTSQTSGINNKPLPPFMTVDEGAGPQKTLRQRFSQAPRAAQDIFSAGNQRFKDGQKYLSDFSNQAQHNAGVVAHRSVTQSPYSLIGVGKGALISAALGALGVGAYFATTAAIAVTLTITPAAVLWAAAGLVGAATLWSLGANVFTAQNLPQGVEETDVEPDIQAMRNEIHLLEQERVAKQAELTELGKKKEEEAQKSLKVAAEKKEQEAIASQP